MAEVATVQHGVDPTTPENEYPVCLCGAGIDWFDCWDCHGEGGLDGEALMEMDPLWYRPTDFKVCDTCHGKKGFWVCSTQQRGE